ncbi:Ectoine hydroxylase-related dioxygenase, phytanoyl-CoA dioxygenase (PhyH) family [Palleronia salina]|uniref:Ectoine hydroxylase-related dioxygenase, phytanoyl-CoA dioxygenase (PhyH) family n=1 Tax=Palleronia salina TaxID=313368 RepID=A0A1M6DP65_9RHOB|nr:phytanoyl-CoA dioxygenase family protein [Palleronia salina]SHI75046.1 Ectoine hydroxylase-related dioxygenase, phytanoyl-CoA dioxygenase (PhyH) family [Palleronia salina]
MLSAEQKRFYDENGYLMVEDVVTGDALRRLQAVTHDLIDASRGVAESDEIYDLDHGHCAETPRLTRIKLPHKVDPCYDEILKSSAVTEVLRDLLGPDVTLLTTKLNTKAPGGGAAVEWHQDWAFYPHTNDTLLAVGLMLDDVDMANGPLQVIPGSHRGPVLSHHANGFFCGAVDPEDPDFHRDRAVTLTGRAGSMTVHHCRTLHGSAPNRSDRPRLVLFYECATADAWPILGAASYIHELGQRRFWDDLQDRLVCGAPCLEPRLADVPVRMPLPPARDNTSIFKTQAAGGVKSAFG